MKQNVTSEQVLAFISTSDKPIENIIRLAKATRTDYEALIGFKKIFEDKSHEIAILEVIQEIAEDYTIAKMIEVLQRKEVKILMDNCIPANIIVPGCNSKNYSAMELCDCLWSVVLDNL